MAVPPGTVTHLVFLITVRIGKTCQVKPLPGPFLAIVRRSEEAVDETLVRIGLLVVQERPNLSRSRRQPDQIETNAPDQSNLAGFWRGSNVVGFQLRKYEAVDGIARP